jgi:hypothetical protein
MKVTDGALKAFYVFFTHRAGASRKMGRHAMDVATAEEMAWTAHQGSRANWSVDLIEAVNFEALGVAT